MENVWAFMNRFSNLMIVSGAPKIKKSFTYDSLFFLHISTGIPVNPLYHINWEECYNLYLSMLEIKYIEMYFS